MKKGKDLLWQAKRFGHIPTPKRYRAKLHMEKGWCVLSALTSSVRAAYQELEEGVD